MNKSTTSPINPVNLVIVKSLTELILSFLYIISNHEVAIQCGTYVKNVWNSVGLGGSDVVSHITDTLHTSSDGVAPIPSSGLLYVLFAVLWNGIFATALTNWAQTFGQSRVNPTTANLIYSSQPIWGAILAAVFLEDTTIYGNNNFILGSIILGASIIAAIYAASLPTAAAPTTSS